MAGITDKIFILPLLTVKLTTKLIKEALEETSKKQIEKFRKEVLGKTMYAKRRAILNPQKNKKEDKKSKKEDKNLGEVEQEKYIMAA